jgi:hypothetical protein
MISAETRGHRRAVVFGILAVGWAAALVVYLTAAPPDNSADDAEATKQYLYQMERVGGKANSFASGIRLWFDALWHGRRLAGTVAFLTLVVAGGYLFATLPLPGRADAAKGDGGSSP